MIFGLGNTVRARDVLALGFSVLVLLVGNTAVFGEEFLGHRHKAHSPIKRTMAHYHVPPVKLVDQDSNEIRFDRALDNDHPVVVEFFFTTCTTFCDLRAARLTAVQQELAQDNIEISFFTITVDPEFDVPDRLLAYSTRVKPIPNNWVLLTGPLSAIHQVEAAFDAINPSADKMLHQPLTFIQAGPDQEWLRLEGMMSSADLADQVRQLMAKSNSVVTHR